jgi:hypothetical protein
MIMMNILNIISDGLYLNYTVKCQGFYRKLTNYSSVPSIKML